MWAHATSGKRPGVYPEDRHYAYSDGKRSILRIANVSDIDFGNYSCKAQNSEGVAEGFVTLTGKNVVCSMRGKNAGGKERKETGLSFAAITLTIYVQIVMVLHLLRNGKKV